VAPVRRIDGDERDQAKATGTRGHLAGRLGSPAAQFPRRMRPFGQLVFIYFYYKKLLHFFVIIKSVLKQRN
jgi:hypothetical protein